MYTSLFRQWCTSAYGTTTGIRLPRQHRHSCSLWNHLQHSPDSYTCVPYWYYQCILSKYSKTMNNSLFIHNVVLITMIPAATHPQAARAWPHCLANDASQHMVPLPVVCMWQLFQWHNLQRKVLDQSWMARSGEKYCRPVREAIKHCRRWTETVTECSTRWASKNTSCNCCQVPLTKTETMQKNSLIHPNLSLASSVKHWTQQSLS